MPDLSHLTREARNLCLLHMELYRAYEVCEFLQAECKRLREERDQMEHELEMTVRQCCN